MACYDPTWSFTRSLVVLRGRWWGGSGRQGEKKKTDHLGRYCCHQEGDNGGLDKAAVSMISSYIWNMF